MSHQYTVLLLVVFFITCTSLPWDKLPTIQPVTVATWQTNKVLCNVNSNKNLFSNKRSCPLLIITKDLDLKHFYAVYFFESGTIYRHISYTEKNMSFGNEFWNKAFFLILYTYNSFYARNSRIIFVSSIISTIQMRVISSFSVVSIFHEKSIC